eukprot:g6118.t1
MADQEQYCYYRLPDSDRKHKGQGERVSVVKYVQKDPARSRFKKNFREQKAFREKVGYREDKHGSVDDYLKDYDKGAKAPGKNIKLKDMEDMVSSRLWARGTYVKRSEKTSEVKIENGKVETFKSSTDICAWDPQHDAEEVAEDVTTINGFGEASLLLCMKRRLIEKFNIYTYVSDIVLVLNTPDVLIEWHRKQVAALVQGWWRYNSVFETQCRFKRATYTIQKKWKDEILRRKLEKMMPDIRRIQRTTMTTLALKKFNVLRKKRDATVRVQSFWRGVRLVRHIERRSFVLSVQKCYRAYRLLRTTKIKLSSEKVQEWYRARHLLNALRDRQLIITAQSFVRKWRIAREWAELQARLKAKKARDLRFKSATKTIENFYFNRCLFPKLLREWYVETSVAAKQGNAMRIAQLVECLDEKYSMRLGDKVPNLVNRKDRLTGQSLLHFAVQSGDYTTVRFLLLKEVWPNEIDMSGRAPIHDSCEQGDANKDITALLLETWPHSAPSFYSYEITTPRVGSKEKAWRAFFNMTKQRRERFDHPRDMLDMVDTRGMSMCDIALASNSENERTVEFLKMMGVYVVFERNMFEYFHRSLNHKAHEFVLERRFGDTHGAVQGPFPRHTMRKWFMDGHLKPSLCVRYGRSRHVAFQSIQDKFQPSERAFAPLKSLKTLHEKFSALIRGDMVKNEIEGREFLNKWLGV